LDFSRPSPIYRCARKTIASPADPAGRLPAQIDRMARNCGKFSIHFHKRRKKNNPGAAHFLLPQDCTWSSQFVGRCITCFKQPPDEPTAWGPWDVGHQANPHKVADGPAASSLHNQLRGRLGLPPFPTRSESEYVQLYSSGVGHSATFLDQRGLGMAVAGKRKTRAKTLPSFVAYFNRRWPR